MADNILDDGFETGDVIHSQYACSPHIIQLINNFHERILQTDNIAAFYDKIWNVDTAEGYGLDVWGRIVSVDRKLSGISDDVEYFGFDPYTGMESEYVADFNNAPFYPSRSASSYELSDTAFRLLIKAKAFANISNSSMADINRLIYMLLGERRIWVFENPDNTVMTLRIVAQDTLQPYELNILESEILPFRPAGVELQIYTMEGNIFGFDDSGLEAWDCGVFTSDSALESV